MKNFALIGAAGYIAPRHMKAIKDTGNNLVAALDPFDSVGIIDSYFPDADFFTEFERFDRHLAKLKREGRKIDYVSICSPNYLHDSHIRFALRHGTNAICEKPLVLNPWNVDALSEIEKENDGSIYNILQLRLHPSIIALKKKIENGPKDKIYDVILSYVTSRGRWYQYSWKGDVSKSGGIATNIGVHFFDMLSWIFGEVKENVVHVSEKEIESGYLVLKRAKIKWFLSINYDYVPQELKENGQRTFRSITIDGKDIEFSEGFADLHTESYKEIFKGHGFGVTEVKQSIEIVQQIRNKISPTPETGEQHPFLRGMKN